MSNKITLVKILPKDGEFSPSREDIERWRQKFAKAETTLEEAVATGEVEVETLPEKVEGEHYLTIVKIGDEDYKPTFEDLENWREVFKEAVDDPDFKIFTHAGVTVEVIPVGKIIDVE